MRLDKYLAETAQCTRSEAKALLAKGRVTVNGAVCKKGDTQLKAADAVAVDGRALDYQQFVYLMLNKPEGVVSASTDKRDTTVVDLVGDAYQIHHGGVPLVRGSAHHSLGLVEHQVHKLLVIQGFAVHGHSVTFFELGVPFFADSTVHLHPPFGKQHLGLAAGALGRLG